MSEAERLFHRDEAAAQAVTGQADAALIPAMDEISLTSHAMMELLDQILGEMVAAAIQVGVSQSEARTAAEGRVAALREAVRSASCIIAAGELLGRTADLRFKDATNKFSPSLQD